MKIRNINLKQRMKHHNVNGLSVTLIDNGQISRTKNYGILETKSNREVNETSLFSACSITKFLTGMTAVKLISEGILHLDEHVNERLITWKVPENEYTTKKNITLRNLLSHQSGIKDPEGSFSELYSNTEVPSMVELLEGKISYCRTPIAPQYEPESEFHYSDAGYCIIQLLIEDVTKKPFDQVVDEYIFKPLELRNSHLHPTKLEKDKKNFACGHNKNGDLVDGKYPIYPYPTASGLWASSLDLAALVLELMNALKGESKIGIPQSIANEMITAQKGKKWAGLGVFLEETETGLEISSMGWGVGFQCMMFAFPNVEKGAVIMTNAELGVHQLEGIIGEIYKSLKLSMLGDKCKKNDLLSREEN